MNKAKNIFITFIGLEAHCEMIPRALYPQLARYQDTHPSGQVGCWATPEQVHSKPAFHSAYNINTLAGILADGGILCYWYTEVINSSWWLLYFHWRHWRLLTIFSTFCDWQAAKVMTLSFRVPFLVQGMSLYLLGCSQPSPTPMPDNHGALPTLNLTYSQ